jgi:hypothetical protein
MKYSAFWKEGQTINEDIVKKEPIKRRLKFFYLLNKILSFDKGLCKKRANKKAFKIFLFAE